MNYDPVMRRKILKTLVETDVKKTQVKMLIKIVEWNECKIWNFVSALVKGDMMKYVNLNQFIFDQTRCSLSLRPVVDLKVMMLM